MWIIQLEEGVFLANGEGDPSRTLNIENALRIKKIAKARNLLKNARDHRPFKDAIIGFESSVKI